MISKKYANAMVSGCMLLLASCNSSPLELLVPSAHAQNRGGQAHPQSTPSGAHPLITTPTSPDPDGPTFTLEKALKGITGHGALTATIETSLGNISCELYPDKTPKTVANFVGLARGLRSFWDARVGRWLRRPYYDGTTFHRVIPGFMIQGGDYLGNGQGTPGYDVPDEMIEGFLHNRAGQLCMANRGHDTNGAQFFILDAPAVQLDSYHSYTIFGQCENHDVVSRIANVPQSYGQTNRPNDPPVIQHIRIRRGAAPAAPAHH